MYLCFWEGLEPGLCQELYLPFCCSSKTPVRPPLLELCSQETKGWRSSVSWGSGFRLQKISIAFRVLSPLEEDAIFLLTLHTSVSLRTSYLKLITLATAGLVRRKAGVGKMPAFRPVQGSSWTSLLTKPRLSGQTEGPSGSLLGGDSSEHFTKGEEES